MSSGANSGLAHGTQGASQLELENYEYAAKLSEIQALIETGNFSPAQKSTLYSLSNNIADHLKERDYSGVQRDLAGDPVRRRNGTNWDHIKEMKDSYRSLKRSKKSLTGSLRNPNLGNAERAVMQSALDQVNYHINRIDAMFAPYGGIEGWIRK